MAHFKTVNLRLEDLHRVKRQLKELEGKLMEEWPGAAWEITGALVCVDKALHVVRSTPYDK